MLLELWVYWNELVQEITENNYFVYGLDLKKQKINIKFLFITKIRFLTMVNKIIKKRYGMSLYGIAEPMKYLTKTSEVIDLTINHQLILLMNA